MSGINPLQLIQYVIRPALSALGTKYFALAAEQLLLATAAQESLCGEYLHQLKGPALGIYQMEPATLYDLYQNYLAYNEPDIGAMDYQRVIYDLRYATQAARLQYYRHPEALPESGNVDGAWQYYRRYWNSPLGAANYAQFNQRWASYVAPVFA